MSHKEDNIKVQEFMASIDKHKEEMMREIGVARDKAVRLGAADMERIFRGMTQQQVKALLGCQEGDQDDN